MKLSYLFLYNTVSKVLNAVFYSLVFVLNLLAIGKYLINLRSKFDNQCTGKSEACPAKITTSPCDRKQQAVIIILFGESAEG